MLCSACLSPSSLCLWVCLCNSLLVYRAVAWGSPSSAAVIGPRCRALSGRPDFPPRARSTLPPDMQCGSLSRHQTLPCGAVGIVGRNTVGQAGEGSGPVVGGPLGESERWWNVRTRWILGSEMTVSPQPLSLGHPSAESERSLGCLLS